MKFFRTRAVFVVVLVATLAAGCVIATSSGPGTKHRRTREAQPKKADATEKRNEPVEEPALEPTPPPPPPSY